MSQRNNHQRILEIAQREFFDLRDRMAQLEQVICYHKSKIAELTPTPSTMSEVSNGESQSEKNPGPPVPETDAACYDAPRTTSVDADSGRLHEGPESGAAP